MLKRYLLYLLLAVFLCGCTSLPNDIANEPPYYQWVDDLNQQVTIPSKPNRVIALTGSFADVWSLAGGTLVGGTKDAISDGRLNLSVVGAYNEPNLEQILALTPDFVLLSSKVKSHQAINQALQSAHIPSAFFNIESVADYMHMLSICTDLTGQKDQYEKYGVMVQKQIDTCLSDIPKDVSPSILLLRTFGSGLETIQGDHNFTSVILKEMNTRNIADQSPSLLKELSIETILVEDPDYIFVIMMGDETQAINTFQTKLADHASWGTLRAVKSDHVYILPKELFHVKPNARWGESYEYIKKILYPSIP